MTRSNDSELVSLPVVGCQFQQYIHQDYQLLERVARLATWSSLFRAGPQFQSYFGQVWCTVHNDQASCRWVRWWFVVCFCISMTYKQLFVLTWYWHPRIHAAFTNIWSWYIFFKCLWSCPLYGPWGLEKSHQQSFSTLDFYHQRFGSCRFLRDEKEMRSVGPLSREMMNEFEYVHT